MQNYVNKTMIIVILIYGNINNDKTNQKYIYANLL